MRVPPDYEEIVSTALQAVGWIDDAFQMANDLEDALNDLLEGFEFQTDSLDDTAALYSRTHQDELWLGSLLFQDCKDSVRLVNCIKPEVPFAAALFDDLREFDKPQVFTKAVFRFRSALSFLRAFAQANYLLRHPPSPEIEPTKSDDATSELQHRTLMLQKMAKLLHNPPDELHRTVPQQIVEANNRQRSAAADDVKRIHRELVSMHGRLPTRTELSAAIRQQCLTIGSNRLQTIVTEINKQSAISPAESAD